MNSFKSKLANETYLQIDPVDVVLAQSFKFRPEAKVESNNQEDAKEAEKECCSNMINAANMFYYMVMSFIHYLCQPSPLSGNL